MPESMRAARRWLPLIAVVTLAACVPAQRHELPATWVDRSSAMRHLSGWSLSGRIGLTVDDRGFNGALSWQQTGETLRMDFRGPLGAGAFRVSGNPDQLVLETGDGELYLLDDPETALADQFGWGVPINAMRYWMLGIPQPGFPANPSFDADGRLASIEQLGWVVLYERYGVFQGWEMPRKLILGNRADIRIKLVISQWTLDGAG